MGSTAQAADANFAGPAGAANISQRSLTQIQADIAAADPSAADFYALTQQLHTENDPAGQRIEIPLIEGAGQAFRLLLGETDVDQNILDGDPNVDPLITYSSPVYDFQLNVPLGGGDTILNFLAKLGGPVAKAVDYSLDQERGKDGKTKKKTEKKRFKAAALNASILLKYQVKAGSAWTFDTEGLRQYARSGNADDILNGFWADDAAGPVSAVTGVSSDFAPNLGADPNELAVLGGVGANIGIDLGQVDIVIKKIALFKGRIEGSLVGGPVYNLNDPNGDGKVRANEFDANAALGTSDLIAGQSLIYDQFGRVELNLEVFGKILLIPEFRFNVLKASVQFAPASPDRRSARACRGRRHGAAPEHGRSRVAAGRRRVRRFRDIHRLQWRDGWDPERLGDRLHADVRGPRRDVHQDRRRRRPRRRCDHRAFRRGRAGRDFRRHRRRHAHRRRGGCDDLRRRRRRHDHRLGLRRRDRCRGGQ